MSNLDILTGEGRPSSQWKQNKKKLREVKKHI